MQHLLARFFIPTIKRITSSCASSTTPKHEIKIFVLITMDMAVSTFLLRMVLCVFLVQLAYAQSLDPGFYTKTCPSVIGIVKRTTASFISQSPSLAAPLLRMHFHDCFVRVSFPFHACMHMHHSLHIYWTTKFLRVFVSYSYFEEQNNRQIVTTNYYTYIAHVLLIIRLCLKTRKIFLENYAFF